MKTYKKFLCILLFVLLGTSNVLGDTFTMTYLYGSTPTVYTNSISRTKGMLNAISPDFLEISTNGTLIVQKIEKSFIDTMHKAGIKVTPFLSNNWDKSLGNACLNNTTAFVDSLVTAVKSNNLDGVNVDIQNVSEAYRDQYTNFVKLLKQKLPDKQISVAVAANPNGWTLGWHGSYDYANLAKNCDYLMIMAYDESYYGSEPMPVASKQFVEGAIKYALKHTTADKLVLGLPFYGRYWKKDTNPQSANYGNYTGGNGITHVDVESLVKKYASVTTYDDNRQSVMTTLTIKPSDTKPTLWGGTTLSAGDYLIWYDNIKSLKNKLDLAEQYKLLGTGSWATGNENTAIWDEYALRKSPSSDVGVIEHGEDNDNSIPNTTPLKDISNSWAYEHILRMYEKGWMTGVSATTFLPKQIITRAEFVTALVRVAQLPLISDELQKPYNFDDTAKHWAAKSIATARYHGLITGLGGNTFKPYSHTTREQAVYLLDSLFNLPKTIDYTKNPFTDLKTDSSHWSYNSIIKLTANEILFGYPDKTFRPYESITREQTAVLLDRVSGYGVNNLNSRQKSFILPR